jgi:hypothetical protein
MGQSCRSHRDRHRHGESLIAPFGRKGDRRDRVVARHLRAARSHGALGKRDDFVAFL